MPSEKTMAQSHPTDTPESQILAMVNAKYRTNLKLSDVVFGQPILRSGNVSWQAGDDPQTHNSSVEISNSAAQPYEFTTTLLFSRLSLFALFGPRDKKFIGDITHTHQLIPLLRERLGLPISEADIAGHDIEGPVGYPKTVLLNAASNSLLLFGSVDLTLVGP